MRLNFGIRNFQRNENGTIAVITAIVIFLIMSFAGAMFDFGAAYTSQSDSQAAADKAVLAATMAKLKGTTEISNLKAVAEKIFKANVPGSNKVKVVSTDLKPAGENTFAFEAQIKSVNAVLPTVGFDDITMTVKAEAKLSLSQDTEVVLAIDNTNSMHFSDANWDQLESDLKALVQAFNGGYKFNLSILWYRDLISVNNFGDTTSDLRDDKEDWLVKGKPWVFQNSKYDTKEGKDNEYWIKLNKWDGCVFPRGPVEPNVYDEEAMGDATPFEIGFVPAEDKKKLHKKTKKLSNNNWLEKKAKKYKQACKERSIFGPTTETIDVGKAFDNIGKGGTGRQDVAVAWAWRLLSPKWDGLWGKTSYPGPYDKTKKVVILVTDGYDNAYDYVFPRHSTSERDDLGSNLSSGYHLDFMDKTCDRMKDEGIEIFVVQSGSGGGNTLATPYFKSCVNNEDTHYMARVKADEIIDAIGYSLASSANAVRVTK